MKGNLTATGLSIIYSVCSCLLLFLTLLSLQAEGKEKKAALLLLYYYQVYFTCRRDLSIDAACIIPSYDGRKKVKRKQKKYLLIRRVDTRSHTHLSLMLLGRPCPTPPSASSSCPAGCMACRVSVGPWNTPSNPPHRR